MTVDAGRDGQAREGLEGRGQVDAGRQLADDAPGRNAGAGGSPEELAALARTALAEAAAGRLRPVIGQEFELAGAARAHAAIEARKTVGKTLLTVP